MVKIKFNQNSFPPLLLSAVPLLCGVVTLFSLAQLPGFRWVALLLPLMVVASKVEAVRPLLWFLLGFFWAAFQAELRLSVVLPNTVEGRDVELTGTVLDLPEQRGETSMRFLFQIESMRHNGERIHFPAKVRLGWYRGAMALQSGERWQLVVRLKRPHGFRNPGGFDWEQWLFQHNIRATGYVRNSDKNRLLSGDPEGESIRERVSKTIRRDLEVDRSSSLHPQERGVKTQDSVALLAALAVGDRQAISPRQWEVLRQTGTSHLMAISGLHVGLVATVLFFLFRWLWSMIPPLLLYLPAQQMGAIAGLSGAIGYAALAGFSIPTQRALVMVAVVMSLILLRRAAHRWSVYWAALVALLFFDPFAPLSAGFWLSFGAVGWILYGLPKRSEQPKWMTLILLQGVLLVGLMPVLLYLFGQGSLIAPVANLIAVPWVSLLVVPVTLSSVVLQLLSLPGADLLIELAAQLMRPLLVLLHGLSNLHYASFNFHTPPLWSVVLALVGTGVLLTPALGRGRWLGLIALLPLYGLPAERPDPGEARVSVLDVGQGLAVVVESHSRVMLYDTGDRFSSTFDAGSAVVNPFLQARGWNKVDLLVIGHDDRDHIGGMDRVLERFPVVEAISSVPQRVENSRFCEAGMKWQWDGVLLEVIHPLSRNQFEGNDASCVVRIEAGGESMLLTGDIEKPAERALLERYSQEFKQKFRQKLNVDGLVVPHHGSNTSSTAEWIDALSPQWGVVPVGYRNRYRLPRADVVERYRAAGVELWSTAEHGAVTVELGQRSKVSGWRSSNLKIWSDSLNLNE